MTVNEWFYLSDSKEYMVVELPDFCSGSDLAAQRESLIYGSGADSPQGLCAPDLRLALSTLYDHYLQTLAGSVGIEPDSEFALLANGGLGRQEVAPFSDIDLLLVHERQTTHDVTAIAESLWYPIWDSRTKLDYSVRTVEESLDVAQSDTRVALNLLDIRYVAGNRELAQRLTTLGYQQWRQNIGSRLDDLLEQAHGRWEEAGRIPHRVDPDLKNGRGGLRDVQLLQALARAQLADMRMDSRERVFRGDLAASRELLLDVRTELQRVSHRYRNILNAQYGDDVAERLDIGDRFDLARQLSDASRTISFAVDAGIRMAREVFPNKKRHGPFRRAMREPLAEGVVMQDGEVLLARKAQPQRDPWLILRMAAASARSHFPISTPTLRVLAEAADDIHLVEPWPADALNDLLVLLGSGPGTVDTVEVLDRYGLWEVFFPEWRYVRGLMPRDRAHIFTVDRHLLAVVVGAAARATTVDRPDLLLLAALIHDLGKGRGQDHSLVGAELALSIGKRLGLELNDRKTLSRVVKEHLLLARIVTRKDISTPDTADMVVDALERDSTALDVLVPLTAADSEGTGPGVWNAWRERMVETLAANVRERLRGTEPTNEPWPSMPEKDKSQGVVSQYVESQAVQRQGVESQRLQSEPAMDTLLTVQLLLRSTDILNTYELLVSGHDNRQPRVTGLLAVTAGVIAQSNLQVLAAQVDTVGSESTIRFLVATSFGRPPDVSLLRERVIYELDAGSQKPLRFSPPAHIVAPPVVVVEDDGSCGGDDCDDDGSLYVEVRVDDRSGLLALIADTLDRAGYSIQWAKVTTRGATALDAFHVVLSDRNDRKKRDWLRNRLIEVLSS